MKTIKEIKENSKLEIQKQTIDGVAGILHMTGLRKCTFIASWGGGWEHVSVCPSNRTPDWDEMCAIKDMFRDELEKLLNTVHPLHFRGNKFREQTIEMMRAQDIWQVIRHRLWKDRHGDKDDWCVDSRKPMCLTGEPLPKMERMEG